MDKSLFAESIKRAIQRNVDLNQAKLVLNMIHDSRGQFLSPKLKETALNIIKDDIKKKTSERAQRSMRRLGRAAETVEKRSMKLHDIEGEGKESAREILDTLAIHANTERKPLYEDEEWADHGQSAFGVTKEEELNRLMAIVSPSIIDLDTSDLLLGEKNPEIPQDNPSNEL